MKSRRSLPLIVLLITAILVLAACAPAPQATEQEEAPKSTEQVTLRLWMHQSPGFNPAMQSLIDAYMAEHPDVTITLETFDYDTYIQTLQTAIPAGTEADILHLFGSWVCSYAEGNNVLEVPADVISVDEARDVFFAAQVGGFICDDKLYGLPQEFNIEYGAVLVNTEIAAEAGLDDVTAGWEDWDALIADAQKLTTTEGDVITRAGFHFTGSDGIATMFHSLILQYGGEYLTEDGYKVNTPEGMQALEHMKSLVDAGLIDPVLFNDDENWVGDSYFEETTAIGLVGPWVIPEYAGDFPEVVDKTTYVPLPTVGDEPVFAAASGWGLTVSPNSKAQDIAWDFLKFSALDADNAAQWNIESGTLPGLKANASGENAEKLVAAFPHFAPFLDILQYGKYEGAFPDRDLVWYEITYPRVLNFLQGNATAEETLETMEREVNESF
jgi:multiple sugar transport system substrate-binding protein